MEKGHILENQIYFLPPRRTYNRRCQMSAMPAERTVTSPVRREAPSRGPAVARTNSVNQLANKPPTPPPRRAPPVPARRPPATLSRGSTVPGSSPIMRSTSVAQLARSPSESDSTPKPTRALPGLGTLLNCYNSANRFHKYSYIYF